MTSVSVTIKPADSRCRYWAKVVRAGTPLPLPSDVTGAADIPGPFSQRGDEELFLGDFLIEGEAVHHSRNRGWYYWVTWCTGDGKWRREEDPDSTVKSQLKAAGLPVELLPGAGTLAACVRVAHAVRLGLYQEAGQ